MGVFRFFISLLRRLTQSPEDVTNAGLEELAGSYTNFAYIGSRRRLKSVVLSQARRLLQRLQSYKSTTLEGLPAERALRLKRCSRSKSPEEAAAAWYGRQDWAKDSGLFPDFALAMDEANTFGNGAIVELKDSNDASIASFNSTIPTRFKSLKEVQEIMGSRLIVEAAWLWDFPLSLADDYEFQPRYCFYLIRTHRRSPEQVRISLVEGSFFETLPKKELLRRLWEQILDESGVHGEQKAQLLSLLAQLKQTAIARSRHVKGASVKPRFRLMAEVEGEANPHNYPEIKERTVNLIIKREESHDFDWISKAFAAEGMSATLRWKEKDGVLLVDNEVCLHYFSVWHRRNGEHWVLQWQLPPIARSTR